MFLNDIYCFGSNRSGQLGCSFIDELTSTPIKLNNLNYISLNRIIISLNNSDIITNENILINCGENDNNELSRNGKKSLFGRVDLFESFTIIDLVRG